MPKNQHQIADSFPADHAAKLSGLTMHMLNYLSRYEIVAASGSSERGRGKRRLYTYTDVLLLRVLAQLLAQGVSVLGLRKSLATYRKKHGAMLNFHTARFFVTDGQNVYVGNGEVLENAVSGQAVFAFVLDLEQVRRQLDRESSKSVRVA